MKYIIPNQLTFCCKRPMYHVAIVTVIFPCVKPIHFLLQKANVSCSYSKGNLFTCQDRLFSHVKLPLLCESLPGVVGGYITFFFSIKTEIRLC